MRRGVRPYPEGGVREAMFVDVSAHLARALSGSVFPSAESAWYWWGRAVVSSTLFSRAAAPVGRVLAGRVADKLREGLEVAFRHGDYCGMGIRAGEGWFVYGQVRDGELLSPSEYTSEGAPPDERLELLTGNLS